jgi:hypothetical protein
MGANDPAQPHHELLNVLVKLRVRLLVLGAQAHAWAALFSCTMPSKPIPPRQMPPLRPLLTAVVGKRIPYSDAWRDAVGASLQLVAAGRAGSAVATTLDVQQQAKWLLRAVAVTSV